MTRPRPAMILAMTMSRFDLVRKAWQLEADDAVFEPLLGDRELLDAVTHAVGKATEKTCINTWTHNRKAIERGNRFRRCQGICGTRI